MLLICLLFYRSPKINNRHRLRIKTLISQSFINQGKIITNGNLLTATNTRSNSLLLKTTSNSQHRGPSTSRTKINLRTSNFNLRLNTITVTILRSPNWPDLTSSTRSPTLVQAFQLSPGRQMTTVKLRDPPIKRTYQPFLNTISS